MVLTRCGNIRFGHYRREFNWTRKRLTMALNKRIPCITDSVEFQGKFLSLNLRIPYNEKVVNPLFYTQGQCCRIKIKSTF